MDKIIEFSVKYHFEFKTASGHVARIHQKHFVHAASEEEAKEKTKSHAEAMHKAHIGPDPKFLVIDEAAAI